MAAFSRVKQVAFGPLLAHQRSGRPLDGGPLSGA